jgi:2,3,4,5-tetrahydropyridine-2-carboxylate N-succinyltransferase
MLISIIDENNQEVKKVKARELAGNSDMLFIRNSQTGQILCKTNRNAIALNEELHKNN